MSLWDGPGAPTPFSIRRITDPARTFLDANHPGPGAAIVVVVPAYNEAPTVAAVVTAVPATLDGVAVATLVVDDGSADDTAEVAAEAGALVCRLPANVGQGRALQIGYRIAAGWDADVIVTVDADGQFDLGDLPALVAPILSGQADFVNGSRRLSRTESPDRIRRLGLVVFAGLVSLVTRTRVTDPANGLRAFRVEVAAAVPLRQPQYQTSELLIGAILRGFRVREVGVTVLPRMAGQSKKGGNFTYGLGFLRAVVTTWWRLRSERT